MMWLGTKTKFVEVVRTYPVMYDNKATRTSDLLYIKNTGISIANTIDISDL